MLFWPWVARGGSPVVPARGATLLSIVVREVGPLTKDRQEGAEFQDVHPFLGWNLVSVANSGFTYKTRPNMCEHSHEGWLACLSVHFKQISYSRKEHMMPLWLIISKQNWFWIPTAYLNCYVSELNASVVHSQISLNFCDWSFDRRDSVLTWCAIYQTLFWVLSLDHTQPHEGHGTWRHPWGWPWTRQKSDPLPKLRSYI